MAAAPTGARGGRPATTLYEELGDYFNQARSLNNLAITLRDLGRVDEAREATSQSARLKAPFGHAAEPWTTWNVLWNIETLAGHPDAAAAARFRAMELYAAYRRDGAEPQYVMARLIAAVGDALRGQGAAAARRLIPPTERFAESLLPVRDALIAIVSATAIRPWPETPGSTTTMPQSSRCFSNRCQPPRASPRAPDWLPMRPWAEACRSTVEPRGTLQDRPDHPEIFLARIGHLELSNVTLHFCSCFVQPVPGLVQRVPQLRDERVIAVKLGSDLSHDQVYCPQPSMVFLDTVD